MADIREQLKRIARELGDRDRQEQELLRKQTEVYRLESGRRETELRTERARKVAEAELRTSIRDLVIARIIQPSISDLIVFLAEHRGTTDSWDTRVVRELSRHSRDHYVSAGYDDGSKYDHTSYIAVSHHGVLLSRPSRIPKRRMTKEGNLMIPQDSNYPDSTQISYGWGAKFQHFFVGFLGIVESDNPLSDAALSLDPATANFRLGLGNRQFLADVKLFKGLDKDDRRAGFESSSIYLDIKTSQENLELLKDGGSLLFKSAGEKIGQELTRFYSTYLPDFPRL